MSISMSSLKQITARRKLRCGDHSSSSPQLNTLSITPWRKDMRVEVVAGEVLSLGTSQVARLVAVRVEERRQGDDDIGCDEQRTLEVVAAAVQD